jgi:hypothetical protein
MPGVLLLSNSYIFWLTLLEIFKSLEVGVAEAELNMWMASLKPLLQAP